MCVRVCVCVVCVCLYSFCVQNRKNIVAGLSAFGKEGYECFLTSDSLNTTQWLSHSCIGEQQDCNNVSLVRRHPIKPKWLKGYCLICISCWKTSYKVISPWEKLISFFCHSWKYFYLSYKYMVKYCNNKLCFANYDPMSETFIELIIFNLLPKAFRLSNLMKYDCEINL